MKSFPIPQIDQLHGAHETLIQVRQNKIDLSLSEWVLFSRYCRYDPRIAETWVLALENHWKSIPPVLLNLENLKLQKPSIFGVLLENLQSALISSLDKKMFRTWKKMVMENVSVDDYENFFIGLRPFASAGIREDAEKSLRVYLKWGFFGRDVLVNKFELAQKAHPKTFLAPAQRKVILDALIQEKERIQIEDYIRECGGAISRRVAQLDLAHYSKVRPQGRTRGKFYRVMR